MRSILTSLLLACAALAQQTAQQTVPNSDADIAKANAKQAQDVINKCIKALGGEAYLNIKDIAQEGRGYGFYQNAPTGTGVPYWRFYRYPDKERYEFTKQRDWIIIHNGDEGYETTFRGTKPEDKKDHDTYMRRKTFALDYVLRDWPKQPGVAFFYDGTSIAGARTVHKITLMNAQDQGVTLFIDSTTFLPIKKSYTWRDEYREMSTEEEQYDQYRPEQGIPTPHVITRFLNGEIASERFISSVKYNTGLPDSLFQPANLIYNKMKK